MTDSNGSSVDRCESPDTSSTSSPFRTFKIDTMAEAQRLIGISLAKIAQSRVCRGGVSLHKNLLVATVLQKARYIFMEEAYHIVHGHYLQQNKCMELEMEKQRHAAAAAAAAAAAVNNNVVDDESCSESEDSDESESYASSETNDESDAEDKENSPPSSSSPSQSASEQVHAEVQNGAETAVPCEEVKKVENSGNKRRRDAETEDAVQSILPKRLKSESDSDQSTALSETVSSQLEAEDLSSRTTSTTAESLPHTPSVESIDRITSLVSIFSFGNLSRSVSTPDFCAAQAKDADSSALTQLQQHSQRGYLTMTV